MYHHMNRLFPDEGGKMVPKPDTDITQCFKFPYMNKLNLKIIVSRGSILVYNRYLIPRLVQKDSKGVHYSVILHK